MALLPSKTFRFCHCDPLQTNFLKSFFHFIKLEWFNDRFDLFHEKISLRFSCSTGLVPLVGFYAWNVPNCCNRLHQKVHLFDATDDVAQFNGKNQKNLPKNYNFFVAVLHFSIVTGWIAQKRLNLERI